ncbi:MAG: tRNA dihydrouridine synthase DusB [Acidobacteria bacterium]|uniref:tRNA-dihydrouridine synthase n=1 Tax=Candidatus Polarisedimenticola svalbardensis TaxID=2886004 RepID=A0A8J6XRA5_9BACT|nr:tRNA dihydrouridine synthase DusB [Candidatus Polarisedimenticola svalbardensis]
MLKYGPVQFASPLILAPMADVTDRQFRLLLKRMGGIGLVTMEFVSSRDIHLRHKRLATILRYSPEERPISIQVYGSDPELMAEAARFVQEQGADVCDINMGCPANKILKGCAGAKLMADLPLARDIIRRCRASVSIPLTVKFRAGMDDGRLNYLELGRICQDEGADGVALHPRTARQMYSGRADWSRIARLKESISIPVVGNGDVEQPGDVLRMMQETGCDGVMIGRASMRNPWIYRQAAALLRGEAPVEPTLLDRRDLILEHFRLLRDEEEHRLAMHKLRTFTGWYTRGWAEGRDLRVRIASLESPDHFIQAVIDFFDAQAA